MRLSAGSKLGCYTILDLLGEGGMGEVYVALDPRLRRKVALKTLHADAASDPGRRDRFAREARTAAALRHPNVVTIYSVEEEEGIPFLTMELLEGGSLRESIPATGMPWDRFLALATPIAEALASAHARGVVHRDLKPDNILVERSGPVKVLDFGLAKAGDEPADGAPSDATRTFSSDSSGGRLVGTLPYMSPEQLEGRLCDPRSDVFSLGIVFYEMLVGRRPFEGATAAVLAASILRDDTVPVRRLRPELPEAADELVGRCLEKSPARRFASAGEIAEVLRALHARGPEARSAPAAARSAVAVLDWVNLGDDRPLDGLSGAIADGLAAGLARCPAWRIVPRERLLRSLGAGGVSVLDEPGLRRLGERVGAAWLIAGGFRASGGELRLGAQVADLAAGRIVASVSASGPLDDVLGTQSRIFAEIAHALGGGPEAEVLAGAPATSDPRAHACWSEGRRAQGDESARAAFERAVRLDPAFARAHDDLGRLYLARRLDRGSADDLEGAVRHLGRAAALDPGGSGVRRRYALACALAGRFEEAEASLAAAPGDDEDPEDAWAVGMTHALRALHGGRSAAWDEAAAALERAARLDPGAAGPHDALGAVELARGRYEAARAALERGEASGGGALAGWAHLRLGDPDRALACFSRARAKATGDPRPPSAASEALARIGEGDAHLQLGRVGSAFEAYRHAVRRIAASPGTPGGGWVQARALYGLARAAAASGLPREAAAAVTRAAELLETRGALDFTPTWLGGEAALAHEGARARAAAGDAPGAMRELARAIAAGWTDARSLASEPAFAALRADPAFPRVASFPER